MKLEIGGPACYGGPVNQTFPYRRYRPAAPAPTARQRALAQWRRWDWGPAETARRLSAQPAGDIMPRVLAGLRMDSRRAETEILKVWAHQMDPAIVAHAQPTGIRKGTLFVTVDSSVWLDEIVRYRRREILERLQNSFGRDLITRISFRTG
jgi:predicted nucleic acid-binding Zn ribbon protein